MMHFQRTFFVVRLTIDHEDDPCPPPRIWIFFKEANELQGRLRSTWLMTFCKEQIFHKVSVNGKIFSNENWCGSQISRQQTKDNFVANFLPLVAEEEASTRQRPIFLWKYSKSWVQEEFQKKDAIWCYPFVRCKKSWNSRSGGCWQTRPEFPLGPKLSFESCLDCERSLGNFFNHY